MMTIEEFADILRDPETQLIENKPYVSNTNKLRGYKAKLKRNGQYYFYSVSATNKPISASVVADAITSPERLVTKKSDTGEKEFYATIKAGNHWYMLYHRNKARLRFSIDAARQQL